MNVKKYEKIRKKLKQSSIGIAGAGGLGSNVAISLARSGIGHLIIVDFDRVEESNLERQYYFRNQIGKIKVEALKENILKINPKMNVETHNQKLTKGKMHTLFTDVDIVIEALDAAEIKTTFVEEIMQKLPDKPIIAASGVAGYGQSDRIVTKKMGNLFMVYDEQAKSSDEDVLLAPKVVLMANWQANIALEILLGEDK
jgi:sulfur carrier protein ThiS adenylyltransferase